jgi:hypothetical protein
MIIGSERGNAQESARDKVVHISVKDKSTLQNHLSPWFLSPFDLLKLSP